MRPTLALFAAACLAAPAPGHAQDPAHALATWSALAAPPAWEHLALIAIAEVAPGWREDAFGNLVLRKGDGQPRRVVACGIDAPSYVVSGIREDGWLRLHYAAGRPRHDLWDQLHRGQRVRVVTRAGAVEGVAAVRSTHLWRGSALPGEPVDIEGLYVDVGAPDAAAVAALGVRLMDPVVRAWAPWPFEGHAAGPDMGRRAGCAALLAAGAAEPAEGEAILLLTRQSGFGEAGLHAALAGLGPVDRVTIVQSGSDDAPAPVVTRRAPAGRALPPSAGVDSVTLLVPRVRHARTLSETIAVDDAAALARAIAQAAGVEAGSLPPPERLFTPVGPAVETSSGTVARGYDDTAGLLTHLADLYGVSGHEGAVRAAVLEAMPAWARESAEVDGAGNVVLAVGPDRDTAVFIAHMDETGWEVETVGADGVVGLRRRGGMFPSLWEGQPALLHLSDDGAGPRPLPGIFLPRDAASEREPETLVAWFGLDGPALLERGVRPGLMITMPKEAARLGATRYTARSLDDRTGSTALLLALRRLDPDRLPRKVVFVWAVEEEVGLIGARAVAARLGSSVSEAYSVDTFVSSESPLETPRFAWAPLGEGPVLRALDNASMTPPDHLDRLLAAAERAGVDVQVGTTNGGTDGSAFVPWGAVQAGLSWPGRYSHSPVEVLDLRDVEGLVELIMAVAGGV